ncbi:MAG: uncharacterized protein QOH55_1284 [Microbacteriaceae bacterium]|nr:uncharacterized protein [Microbacteriaceae bacterium]
MPKVPTTGVKKGVAMTTHGYNLDEWSPQGPVTELSDAVSWELLNGASFGRLGVSVNDQPEIFPVNYYADGTSILFRTAAGTKLHELLANRTVVFEADAQTENGAWSVIAKGSADVLVDEAEVNRAERSPLPSWIPVLEYVFVRITVTELRGRRFQHQLRPERRDDDEGNPTN